MKQDTRAELDFWEPNATSNASCEGESHQGRQHIWLEGQFPYVTGKASLASVYLVVLG